MSNTAVPPPGPCYIFNVQSGMAMTLPVESQVDIHKDGTQVQGRAFSGGDIQKWVFERAGNTVGYTIRNVASGTYVGYTQGLQADVNKPVTSNSNTVPLTLVGDAGTGYIILANYRPTLVLDLQGGSRTDGTSVIYGNMTWGDKNQRWKFVAA
ncbi:hypothetical protein RSOLAG22IIIB_10146 [Rhizoctonia solani]|uniref:Ricin B lectin domain-containing protein n=1 Tax=Rhizoctonia solani TaxID=456999 RepID=A0A0K6G2J6_9AGAM|nr:hypothetical protein RSOLAG22IIIB_10146 [Rhizoctonia solani]